MHLSIRNQFPGTVESVTEGRAMAAVTVRLDGGGHLTAAITRDAVRDLGLTAGSPVRALIKSTEVSLAAAPVGPISIRNRLPGTVTEVTPGEAMATVKVSMDGGGTLTSAITAEGASDLGLAPGAQVVALIKATEVSLAAGS